MKLLRETVRNIFLTESMHPKISNLCAFVEKSDKLEIHMVMEDSDYLEIKLINGEYEDGMPNVVGHLETFQDKKNLPCLGGFEILWSSVEGGFGPLLYDLAMEYATEYGGGLMCDRRNVSSAAYQIWDKYLNLRCKPDKFGKCTSADIQIKQLDTSTYPKTETPFDDCEDISSFEHWKDTKTAADSYDQDEFVEHWFSNSDPLSKVYAKTNRAVTKRLASKISWFQDGITIGAPSWAK